MERGGGSPQGRQGQQQNIFYKLANGDIPAKTVFENQLFRAILDKEPATKGHTLILPKDEMQISPQLSPEHCAALAEAVKEVSGLLLQGLGAEGTNVFVANGPEAGQNAPHVIVHVIPRSENDGVGLQPKPKEIADDAFDEARSRLEAALGVSDEPRPEPDSGADNDVDLDQVQNRFS